MVFCRPACSQIVAQTQKHKKGEKEEKGRFSFLALETRIPSRVFPCAYGLQLQVVSAAMENERLDDFVLPRHYALLLSPSLRSLTFKGKVEISLQVCRQTSDVRLHAVDLKIEKVKLRRHHFRARTSSPSSSSTSSSPPSNVSGSSSSPTSSSSPSNASKSSQVTPSIATPFSDDDAVDEVVEDEPISTVFHSETQTVTFSFSSPLLANSTLSGPFLRVRVAKLASLALFFPFVVHAYEPSDIRRQR